MGSATATMPLWDQAPPRGEVHLPALVASGDSAVTFPDTFSSFIDQAIDCRLLQPHLLRCCYCNCPPIMGSLGEPTFSAPTEVVSAHGFLFDFDGEADSVRQYAGYKWLT